MYVSRWTVDYGDGPHPAIVPHAWGQEVSVEWEGPAVYRTELDVPRGGGTLRFWGVSYLAEVFANGEAVARHEGIWDAFDVALPGGRVELEVRVTKNGGTTYPVGTVASGGLPHLFNTFGGIYREVELLEEEKPLVLPPPPSRAELPYVRGIVHRGWYPDLGHPNPDEHLIRRELREIKALGFNTVKFAGWVPPHRYLDLLEAEGLLGWIELPIGGMDFEADRAQLVFDEAERIVLQYRHHASIALWSLGDVYLAQVPISQRLAIVDYLRAMTGVCVGDGTRGQIGDIGDFDDLSEIGDPTEADRELRLLYPGPREERPVYLGNLASAEAHRDLSRLGDELPYWASALSELNARGVRLGGNLAERLELSRYALEPTRSGHRSLMASSQRKEAFVRKTIVETVRSAADWVRGYALAELRDTPISSAGLFDDWGTPRLQPVDTAAWNGSACLFPLGYGRWSGHVQPDPLNHFAGRVRLRIGLHTELALSGRLWWRIVDEKGRTAAKGAGAERQVQGSHEIGAIVWPEATPGQYRLEVGFGPAQNAWNLWVVEEPDWGSFSGWSFDDSDGGLSDLDLPGGNLSLCFGQRSQAEGGLLILDREEEGTRLCSMWSECALEFRNDDFWAHVPFREQWSRLLPISAEAALSPEWLKKSFGEYETLLERIDTSSYGFFGDAPLLVRAGRWIVTTLRPEVSSQGLNPAGCALLASLMQNPSVQE